MSDSKSTNAKRRRQAEQSTTGEDIRLGAIIAVGFISLALFGVGIGWSYGIQSGREEEIHAGGQAKMPTQLGKQEIGIVDQELFDTDRRLEIWTAQNLKKLSSYGWVDRAKGIAHMPIEAAMQQVIANPPDIAGEGVPLAGRPMPRRAQEPSPSPSPSASPSPSPAPSATGATGPARPGRTP